MYKKLAHLLAFSLLCGVAAHASPILYTVSDTGSGSLGGTAFTNQKVVVSFLGDTTGVTHVGGFYTDSPGIGTVSVAGLALATFTDTVEFFDNQGAAAAGIGDITVGASILDTFNSAFATYTGKTPIGPLTGSVFFSPGTAFGTNKGAFKLNTAGEVSTFAAVSPVPEPSTFALLATGILGVAGAVRRRFSSGV